MTFITKHLFVNEKCIMYGDTCTSSGTIGYESEEIWISLPGSQFLKIPFDDEFEEMFEHVEELYRRILFLRFGVPEDN